MSAAAIPRLPTLVDVPVDARRDRCLACGIVLYAVGRQPITCEPVFKYRDTETDMRPHGVKHPTDTEPGRGWNHFADCPERDRFRRDKGAGGHASPAPARAARPEPPPAPVGGVLPSDAQDAKDPVLLAEIVRQRTACKMAGVQCSAPGCDAFAIVVITAAGERLVAFPCSTHADDVVDAMHAAGHTIRVEPPTKFLEDAAHPEWRSAMVKRARDVREYFAKRGTMTFPPASHGSRRGL